MRASAADLRVRSRRRVLNGVPGELVADAAHGHDEFRPRVVLLDLGAQAVDVAIDVVFVAVVAVAPYRIEELQPAVDPSPVTREMQEQIELLGGEIDEVARQRDLA